ncbi:nitrilase-related carbon-nitrogen hydrolase [Lichenifustis flavocetrariae]|uniref:CN hydrolase domain-containing protein n=1 Tax=Lichenifustis flavocetrariae TaxID=2949735 RepID=A0AA41Z7C2_9HYPH|nr:nitrilase-related carbon-nitrogen hydrolase [Lichenifustis flavocetrariae]MCW6511665.1 hypothetical protein [Lichenifustis flavocetrariae]
MSELAVAAAQIECRPGDIDSNLALHLTAVAEARAQGINLLVFPELSLTDYMSEPDVDALARTADAPELCRVAEAAGRTAVSMGFLERGEDGRIYNAQALLADGRCLSVHRKLNLPSYGRLQETRHYCRGDTLTSAGWRDGWTVATLICADTWNPALPRLAALGGATLLATPVASSLDAVDEFDNPGGWDLNLRHTALTYGLPIVMANHCGRRGGLSFWGGSRVLDPFGRDLVRLDTAPGLGVARLRQADVVAARARLPTIRDADPQFVHSELGRLLASG